ncbi:hypothetical protein [Nocardia farcinica]|uniref:hypothetical protein n=1 Tax=Nocardia farcinica TaxID=37329 RepID=UPI002453F9D7|nr:hypothetical protein [Nocardia farcinica]
MPPRLYKPTDVPEDYEQLIDMLWRFYIAADEPPVRKIARAIEELPDDQRRGTANHETIRRTLRALTLPQWETVEVIFLALCQIADVDPDDIDNGYRDSHRDLLHWCYRLARYGEVAALPRTREEKARQEAEAEAKRRRKAALDDPWGSPPSAGAFGRRPDDEPPF